MDFVIGSCQTLHYTPLKLTFTTPKNWWLEDKPFLFGILASFQELWVLGRQDLIPTIIQVPQKSGHACCSLTLACYSILLMVQKSGKNQLRLVVYPIIYKCFIYIYIHPRWCRISYKSTRILTDLLRTDMRPKDIVLKVWFGLLHHTLTTLLDPEMWCSSYKTLFPYRTTLTPMNVEHSLQKHHFPLPSPKFDKDVSLNHYYTFTQLVSTSVPSTMLNWVRPRTVTGWEPQPKSIAMKPFYRIIILYPHWQTGFMYNITPFFQDWYFRSWMSQIWCFTSPPRKSPVHPPKSAGRITK